MPATLVSTVVRPRAVDLKFSRGKATFIAIAGVVPI